MWFFVGRGFEVDVPLRPRLLECPLSCLRGVLMGRVEERPIVSAEGEDWGC
jgi:hypothetical protein